MFIGLGFSQKKDTSFIITKHTNGKIATKKVKLTNDIIRGYAKAFDKTGKVIYNEEIRNYAGHSSVDFYFYANGAVEKAHYGAHPDGGIQWSDITHYFDENGNLLRIEDNSSDEFGHYRIHVDPRYLADTIRQPVKVIQLEQKQEVIACAEIYQTEFYLINATGKKRTYSLRLINAHKDSLPQTGIISKSDTIKMGNYIEAQLFTHPKDRYKIEVVNGKKDKFQLFWEEPKQQGKNMRRYFLIAAMR
jgi:hypothetical protein